MNKIVKAVSLVGVLGACVMGVNTQIINADAQEIDSQEIEQITEEGTQATEEENSDFYYEIDFTGTGVTTAELEAMTLGEYYSKFFPEAWEQFSDVEKETYNNTPFSQKERGIFTEDYYVKSTISTSDSTYLIGKSSSLKDGSYNCSSIKHSQYIDDSNGNAVAGSISSHSTAGDYPAYVTTIRKAKSTCSKTLSYRIRNIHAFTVNGKVITKTSTSSYVKVS